MVGPAIPNVVLVGKQPDSTDRYASWLADDCRLRIATDTTEALERLHPAVDVVLLSDRVVPSGADPLLAEIRERGDDCGVALVRTGESDSSTSHFDASVRKPLEAAELRSLVAELAAHSRIESKSSAPVDGSNRRTSVNRSSQGTAETSGEDIAESGANERQMASGERSTPLDGKIPFLPRYETRPREFYLLWSFAVLTYGFGDVFTTTLAVLGTPALVESNPALAAALSYGGLPGFITVKLAVFCIMLTISVRGTLTNDRLAYYWPPVLTAFLGVLLTGWNIGLLIAHY